jgi:hypothetical protein
MLVVQIIISVFSAGGLIMILVSLPGGPALPHFLSLAGVILTALSIILKKKWLKSLLFILGALSFALFLGFLIMAMNMLSAM